MNAIGVTSCIVFVAVLISSGIAARWLTSRRSGWRRLCQRYPAQPAASGRVYRSSTVRVNGQLFPGRVTVGVSGAGIGLTLPHPFRMFHPPMFVPWDDLTLAEPTVNTELPIKVGDSSDVALTGAAAEAAVRLLARRDLHPRRR